MRTKETIQVLNRLVRTCRDDEQLCKALSAAAGSPNLATSLRARSEEWGRRADELQALVLFLDGEPETSGTPGGWLSRKRLRARSALLGRGDTPALEEWQRMQRTTADRYEEALHTYLPERIRRTVSLQADRLAGWALGQARAGPGSRVYTFIAPDPL